MMSPAPNGLGQADGVVKMVKRDDLMTPARRAARDYITQSPVHGRIAKAVAVRLGETKMFSRWEVEMLAALFIAQPDETTLIDKALIPPAPPLTQEERELLRGTVQLETQTTPAEPDPETREDQSRGGTATLVRTDTRCASVLTAGFHGDQPLGHRTVAKSIRCIRGANHAGDHVGGGRKWKG
jgi:hypothetical protein